MDPVTMALFAGGGGLAKTLLGVGSYFANKNALKNYPQLDTTAATNALNLAKQMAGQEMPGLNVAKEQIASSEAARANKLAEIGGNSAGVLGAVAQGGYTTNQAYNALATRAAEYRLANQQRLADAYRYQQGLNSQLYQNQLAKWNLGRMNTQQLYSNIGQGLGDVAAAGANAAGYQSYIDMMKGMSPWTGNAAGLNNGGYGGGQAVPTPGNVLPDYTPRNNNFYNPPTT